jgi:putative ABC transport system permease protein
MSLRGGDLVLLALGAVRGQRLRSGLTVLGIGVGILAVVLLTALGEGVRRFVIGEFSQFGTNVIAVTPGKRTTFGVSGATISSVRPLTSRMRRHLPACRRWRRWCRSCRATRASSTVPGSAARP